MVDCGIKYLVRPRGIVGLCVLVLALTIGGVSTAYAAKSYTLEPTRTLIGECGKTTKLDPVEDPGCPEGKHPSKAFKIPLGNTVDFYGDIYVSSFGKESANGKEGRIDIFNPEGFFLTELSAPVGPKDIAVDSKGNLYVFAKLTEEGSGKVLRYEPSAPYEPEVGKIEYGKAPVTVIEISGAFFDSIAINPSNDHLFLKKASSITEFKSAVEGNGVAEEGIGSGELEGLDGQGLAIDAAHGLIYAASLEKVKVLKLAPPHNVLQTIESSDLPEEGKLTESTSVAADESTGNFFIFDGTPERTIYEFTEEGATTVVKGLERLEGEVAIDNGPFSLNSGFNSEAKAGYLFATDIEEKLGINYAFEPPNPPCSPEIESISFANVTQEDAELRATINPCRGETEYVFEYASQESFEEEEFAGATVAGEGKIPAGTVGVPVFAPAAGLSPETIYHFRVVATNEATNEGPPVEADDEFTTFPAFGGFSSCLNDATRTGASALLPDCRAYEIVTPPNTNARAPRGIGKTAGIYFATREASPAGDKVSFITEGGSIPGLEGTGSLSGDAYLATRGKGGWGTASAGPTGAEAVTPLIGSTSPDQGYSFWGSNSEGPAAIEGKNTTYLRYPDGHSDLLGRGSEESTDPLVVGQLIAENGAHVIFSGSVKLEPNAPPDGTVAIYDRTIDQETGEEETHVVSLLPESETPLAGKSADYKGASLDGKGVAFTIDKKLYLRFDNQETYEIGENVTFEGVAEGGARIFYLKGGDLFAFDVKAEEAIQFTEAGNVTPVNVAAEGTAAYFVSPSALTGEEENPNGAKAQATEQNLYLSREGTISFVGIVTKRDVEGEFGETEQTGGLGLWALAVGASGSPGTFAKDPSRTTPDGGAMLFESRADLAGYDPEGHAEIYRYDSTGEELECLSCNLTQAPATSDASLQSILEVQGGPEPLNSLVLVNNLRADGQRAFFQSTEALVPGDTDGLQDVYEWEAQGVGSCERPEGCIYLISSGRSNRIDYLYAVSDSGDDVFFRSSDLLVPADTEDTPSIYDARVGGGFAEEPEGCQIDQDCGGSVTPPPSLGAPASEALGPPDNFTPPKKCPKGKHKVTKNGKTICVKKNQKKHHKRHRAGSKKKGAGK